LGSKGKEEEEGTEGKKKKMVGNYEKFISYNSQEVFYWIFQLV
jgi:hypothetical protein